MCDTHIDELPYIRKKLDLLEYQLEVCYEEGDMEGYLCLIGRRRAGSAYAPPAFRLFYALYISATLPM